jgi:hypothetical protein
MLRPRSWCHHFQEKRKLCVQNSETTADLQRCAYPHEAMFYSTSRFAPGLAAAASGWLKSVFPRQRILAESSELIAGKPWQATSVTLCGSSLTSMANPCCTGTK